MSASANKCSAETSQTQAASAAGASGFSNPIISRRSLQGTGTHFFSYDPTRVKALHELGRQSKAFLAIYPAGVRLYRHSPGPLLTQPMPGRRGVIRGFSQASHRRCVDLLMACDWSAQAGDFMSLTWHWSFDLDNWPLWKAQLQAFVKRLQRAYPDQVKGLFWRFEWQTKARLAPHFHLAVLWKSMKGPAREHLRQWVAKNWRDIVEPNSDAHMLYGTDVTAIRNTSGWELTRLLAYLTKYLGKLSPDAAIDESTGECLPQGRVWGYMGDLPLTTIAIAELDQDEFEAFCTAVNAYGERRQSWYLQAISPLWQGFRIYGPGLELFETLTERIPGIRFCPRHGLGPATL